MRLARSTNRRRITRIATRGSIAAGLQLDRKPDRYRDHRQNNYTPHHGGNLFRAPASRRVIGGVVEFLLHGARLPAKRRWAKSCQTRIYRNTAMSLSHSDAPSRSPSCFEGAGCAALTGSDAGKLPTRPAWSFAWVSRSAKAASRGSAACLSCGAGSNFSAMLGLHPQDNAFAIRTFPNK